LAIELHLVPARAGGDGCLEDFNDPLFLLVVDQTWTILDQICHAFWVVARLPKVAVGDFRVNIQLGGGLHDRCSQFPDLFFEFRVREHHVQERDGKPAP